MPFVCRRPHAALSLALMSTFRSVCSSAERSTGTASVRPRSPRRRRPLSLPRFGGITTSFAQPFASKRRTAAGSSGSAVSDVQSCTSRKSRQLSADSGGSASKHVSSCRSSLFNARQPSRAGSDVSAGQLPTSSEVRCTHCERASGSAVRSVQCMMESSLSEGGNVAWRNASPTLPMRTRRNSSSREHKTSAAHR